MFGAIRDVLGSASSWRPLSDIVSSSYVDRTNPDSFKTPNWSFVNNHDQEHNALKPIPLTEEEANGAKPKTLEYEMIQFEKYSKDRAKADKQYTPHNVPSQYAYILTNKDTVPTVFYGDLFEGDKSYMSEKTPFTTQSSSCWKHAKNMSPAIRKLRITKAIRRQRQEKI